MDFNVLSTTRSPQDSQTQVISKYTYLNSSHIYTNLQVNLQNQSLCKQTSPQDSQTRVISKYTFLNSSHLYINLQVNLQKQSLRRHKTYIYKHQTQIFEELVPSILPLLKEHIRLGHAGTTPSNSSIPG